MIINYDNKVYNATITASTESPQFTFSVALKDTRLCRVGRTIACTAEYVVCDLGAAYAIDHIHILNTNLTASATVTIEANTSNSWGSPAYSAALTQLTTDTWYVSLPAPQTYRWWRITFADSTNPDGYVEIGALWIAPKLVMPEMSREQTLPRRTQSETTRSVAGQLYGDRRVQLRSAAISYPSVSEALRQSLLTMFAVVDITEPFVMLLWEDDLDIEPPIYCSFTKDLEFKKNPQDGLDWSLQLEFMECK